MNRFRPPIPYFASLSLCQALAIGAPAWKSLDFQEPVPGHCLAAQGSRLLAGDAEGMRESRDSGATWKPVTSLPGTGPVYALYPAYGLLLAVRSGSIYRSTDSGTTWSPADGKPSADPSYRFQRSGDSLFLLESRFLPHPRMLSLDQGRSWTGFAPWERDLPPILAEAQPGILFKLWTDGLSRSTDGGLSWTPFPWDTMHGNIAALDAAQGNLYVTTEQGIFLKSGALEGEWHALTPNMRAAVPLALAASGQALCASTALGVSCSQDGGGRFSFLLADPYSPTSSDLAVAGERLYLARTVGYVSRIWSHPLSTLAGPWRNITDTTLTNPRLAARPGLLLVPDGQPPGSVFLYKEQGGTFERIRLPADPNKPVQAALGKRYWALGSPDNNFPYWLRPSVYTFYLSGDSGLTYRRLPRAPSLMKAMGLSDSSLIGLDTAGHTHEFRFRDSAWYDLPTPEGGRASAMAASDSVLYVFSGGKLWRNYLYDNPAPIRDVHGGVGRKRSGSQRIGVFVEPGGGVVRDVLGKGIERRP